jgi:hypothetical protein
MAVFDIDIVGTCNLSCPSCPTGNFTIGDFAAAQKRPTGLMKLELFRAILEKDLQKWARVARDAGVKAE